MMDNNVTDDQLLDSFDQAMSFNSADRLYEAGDNASVVIDNRKTSRYYRIKALVLLGNILKDLDHANRCRAEAEELWSSLRRWKPAGIDEAADKIMTELRQSLDQLTVMLHDKRLEHRVLVESKLLAAKYEDAVQDVESGLKHLGVDDSAGKALNDVETELEHLNITDEDGDIGMEI